MTVAPAGTVTAGFLRPAISKNMRLTPATFAESETMVNRTWRVLKAIALPARFTVAPAGTAVASVFSSLRGTRGPGALARATPIIPPGPPRIIPIIPPPIIPPPIIIPIIPPPIIPPPNMPFHPGVDPEGPG
ncbi:MAG: hypothetical protein M0002_17225 [Rhodospirillales bacterium]|nr:hypothetical protein [Rhodospirillales bacterium]